jgi:hypothetical protein
LLTIEESLCFARRIGEIDNSVNSQFVDYSWKVAEPMFSATRRLLNNSRKWRYGFLFVKDNARPVFQQFSSSGYTIIDKRYCDLGCGSQHPFGTVTIMFLNGASSALAVDVLPIENPTRSAEALYDLLVQCLAHPEDWHWSELSRGNFLDRIRMFNLAALRDGNLASGLAAVPIKHVVTSIYDPEIEFNSIDIMSSRAVLEHFLNFDIACSSLYNLMALNGVAYHHIDLVDHRAYSQSDINWWTFLTEEEDWSDQNTNRLRCSEIKSCLENAGFTIIQLTHESDMTLPEAIIENLKGRFKSMTREEISKIRANFLITKTKKISLGDV